MNITNIPRTRAYIVINTNPRRDAQPYAGRYAHSGSVIAQGYIYPAGLLNGSRGVLDSGEPEFPDAVLGTWTSYGAYAETGATLTATQVYQFNDGSTIITNGMDLPDIELPIARIIAGGASYARLPGEPAPILHGFADAMGIVLSV